jgi:hypothetical protein
VFEFVFETQSISYVSIRLGITSQGVQRMRKTLWEKEPEEQVFACGFQFYKTTTIAPVLSCPPPTFKQAVLSLHQRRIFEPVNRGMLDMSVNVNVAVSYIRGGYLTLINNIFAKKKRSSNKPYDYI